MMDAEIRQVLSEGLPIPAHPLALTADGRFDERHQRALTRYYAAAGVGGLAVGVHTTQFAIRDPAAGLFEPVLSLAREEMDHADRRRDRPLARIGGICGPTGQALNEAALLRDLGYHAGLLSLAALRDATDDELVAHCRRVADVLPLVGFYLQSSVGGRPLGYRFWRCFAEIDRVVAIKIAPFNRYQTIDVIRAVVDSGRDDIALYTGNDDSIVVDLVTPFCFPSPSGVIERRITGGLLGHWAVWTRRAVDLFAECRAAASGGCVPRALLRTGIAVTDCNAALFDAANGFGGCIAGIQEVLKRQGLLASTRTLAQEHLGPGQRDAIDRVCRAYPHVTDDEFVAAHLEEWLRP
jgi:hypothetical protein